MAQALLVLVKLVLVLLHTLLFNVDNFNMSHLVFIEFLHTSSSGMSRVEREWDHVT